MTEGFDLFIKGMQLISPFVLLLIATWIGGLKTKQSKTDDAISALNNEIFQLKLRLAEEYHSHDDLKELLNEKLKPITELLNQVVYWIEAQSGGAPLPRKIGK